MEARAEMVVANAVLISRLKERLRAGGKYIARPGRGVGRTVGL
jgi:hypothetical protein